MMIVHQVLVVLLLLLIRSSLRMPVSATKVTVHIADADDRVIDTEYFDEALYRTCVEDTQELFRAYIRDPTEEKAASIEERVLRGDLPVECIAAVEAVVNHMHDDDNTNALMLACHKHHNVLVQKLVLNSGIDLNAASTKRGPPASVNACLYMSV